MLIRTIRKSALRGACAVAVLAVALFAGNVPAQAQNADGKKIFLASASTEHPNARPQWSKEQAEAWMAKVGPIRGVNHPVPPCGAVSQDEALALAARCGFNSVRWFLFGSSATEYCRNVENAAKAADKYGMTVAPVFGFASVPTTAADSLALERMVRYIARTFRGDDRVILWDLWNEPSYSSSESDAIMGIISLMAKWMREEGCTQAITSSILWGSAVNTVRDKTEAEMDIHNFHDYSTQSGRGTNVASMVSRMNGISDRPAVCTEALTRPNGSGVAMSLRQFAKYGIGFYTWGLYTCDSNWDVKWHRSTYYAFEPMFHNLFYAGGDPFDEREEEYIRNFKYTTDEIYPGMEFTDQWPRRRAWKWMCDVPVKALRASSVAAAKSLISAHASDGTANCIVVRLKYSEYTSAGATSYYNTISSLISTANAAGMKLIPVLLTSGDLTTKRSSLATYMYNIVNKFYNNPTIEGWCLFEQNSSAVPSSYTSLFAYLFTYVRYAFPNQPMFAAPLVSATEVPDSTSGNLANYLWRISDVTAFVTADGGQVAGAMLDSIFAQYGRPLFFLTAPALQPEFATRHVNWATNASFGDAAKKYKLSPLTTTAAGDTTKMPTWKAWAQMNDGALKGMVYTSIANALKGMPDAAAKGYNCVTVRMDFDRYNVNRNSFITQFESLLDSAGSCGLKVIPSLLYDRYARRNLTALKTYLADIISTYNNDERIAAWEVFSQPCASTTLASLYVQNLPGLMAAARSASPQRPVFITPSVSVQSFARDYDYINALAHYGTGGGWNKLYHGNGSVKLTYLCWQLSDIAAFASAQDAPQFGWLCSVAYRFGRPVVCMSWNCAKSTTQTATLDVLADHHASWFVSGTLDDDKISSFKFKPVITDH